MRLFEYEVMHHTFLHVNFDNLMKSFNYDAHPMGMFISGIAALSTFHPDANPALKVSDLSVYIFVRRVQIFIKIRRELIRRFSILWVR